jgi:hypothetical protein
MRKTRIIVAAMVIVFGLSFSAHATLGVNFTSPSPTETFTSGNSYSLGWEFTVGSNPLFLTSLGYFVLGSTAPLVDSHPVGLFDSSGNLIISETVTNADPLNSWWRWVDVTASSVVLGAGQTYIVAAPTLRDSYTFDPPGFSVDPNIAFNKDLWEFSTLLVFPTNTEPGVTFGYFGPNIDYRSSVPEPSMLLLLSSGLLSLAGLRRWVKK